MILALLNHHNRDYGIPFQASAMICRSFNKPKFAICHIVIMEHLSPYKRTISLQFCCQYIKTTHKILYFPKVYGHKCYGKFELINVSADNFYSHAPHGTWQGSNMGRKYAYEFLLTRPSRDVTRSSYFISAISPFLLTRPSRDVTTCIVLETMNTQISTHTPLTGRDTLAAVKSVVWLISTHTPLTGRDF